jgi:hypothetical protein
MKLMMMMGTAHLPAVLLKASAPFRSCSSSGLRRWDPAAWRPILHTSLHPSIHLPAGGRAGMWAHLIGSLLPLPHSKPVLIPSLARSSSGAGASVPVDSLKCVCAL